MDSLAKGGFVVDTIKLKRPASWDSNQKYGYLLAADGMAKMSEGRGDFLPKATNMALEYLSQDKDGFFLMVEGSQIDWGGHANDADWIIDEVQDFDQAIKAALDFAAKFMGTYQNNDIFDRMLEVLRW